MSIEEHIGEGGLFTEGFAGEMKTALGKGYEETKFFDDAKDLSSVFKIAIDSRAKISELGEQLKATVNRPGADASDEDKAAYRKTLQKELGASDKLEDYVVGKPDNIPKGLPFNEDAPRGWAQMFMEQGIPVDVAKGIMTAIYDRTIEAHNTKLADAQKVFDTEVEEITSKHQPDDLKIMGRQVVSFINLYGSEDVVTDGVTQEGMKTMTTNAGMFSTPDDFEKWKALGVNPKDFMFMAKIGRETDGGGPKGGTPGPASQSAVAEAEAINAISGKSPGMKVPVPA